MFDKALENSLGASLWIMALSLSIVVVLRYTVGYGATWLNDLAVYLLASMCLLGLGPTLQHHRHVRLDIFYTKMNAATKAWVNLIGNLVILVPLCIFLIVISMSYVFRSWQLLEGSGEAAGLGGLYIVKTLLLFGPGLLMIQAIRHSFKLVQQLFLSHKTPTL